MFRKQIAAILTAVLVLSLGTACANPSQNTAPSSASDEEAVVEESNGEDVEEGTAASEEGVAMEETSEAVDAVESAGAESMPAAPAPTPAAGATADSAQEAEGAPAQAKRPRDARAVRQRVDPARRGLFRCLRHPGALSDDPGCQ